MWDFDLAEWYSSALKSQCKYKLLLTECSNCICSGLTQQAVKHHTVIHSLPTPSGMGKNQERKKKKVEAVGEIKAIY